MLNSMSARDKNALIVLVTIVIAALSYIYLYEPTWIEYKHNSAILEQKRIQLDSIEEYKNDSSSLSAQIEDNTNKIDNISLQLPNHPQTAELLYMLQTAAEEANVKLVKLENRDSPEATGGNGNSSSIPYMVLVKGKNDQIIDYLKLVENLERKLLINNVKIDKDSQDNTINAYINFAAHYLNKTSAVKYNPNKLIP